VRRLLVPAVVIATVGTSVVASASSLGLGADSLGAGNVAVAACDGDGFSPSYTTVGGNVTTVTVGGIDGACAGGALSVTLTDGGVALASGGPVTVAGASAVVSLSPQPDAELVDGIHVLVNGP
jgi:hypothetical protein